MLTFMLLYIFVQGNVEIVKVLTAGLTYDYIHSIVQGYVEIVWYLYANNHAIVKLR